MTRPYTTALDREAGSICRRLAEMDDDRLLTTRQVAELLNVSMPWLNVRRMKGPNRRTDGPPYVRVGRSIVRYPAGALLRWLEERAAA